MPSDAGRIRAEFEYVRRTFFPRWDLQRKWSVDLVDEIEFDYDGFCLHKLRSIRIQHGAIKSYDPTELLIHEISHAVTPVHLHGHCQQWHERMEKAARKAEAIGRAGLAVRIRQDALQYQHELTGPLLVPGSSAVYSWIVDAVCDGDTTPEFEKVIRLARSEFQIPDTEEFMVRFKRCRSVYDEAVRSREADAALRRLFGQ
jgi:hypothetical protein